MRKTMMFAITLAFILSYAIFTQAQSGKFFGGIWQWNSVSECPASFTELFNQVTPESAGKWGPCEPTRGQFTWQKLDAMYAWSDSTGNLVKEHAFVWGQQTPSWINNYSNADTVKAIVANWISTFLKRYGAKTDMIDVVNEPFRTAVLYSKYLGGAGTTGYDWIVWVFQTARDSCNKYAPQAKLLINEYDMIKNTNDTKNYVKLVRLLKSKGLVDGVGEQGHFLESVTDTAMLRRNLDTMAATGLPVYISELDINFSNDQDQLNCYKRLFPLFWEHPGVKGITLWGYQQGKTWIGNSHLIRTDGTERPALTWLKSYMAQTSVSHTISQASPAIHKIPSSHLTLGTGNNRKLSPAVIRTTGNKVDLYKLNGSRINREKVVH